MRYLILSIWALLLPGNLHAEVPNEKVIVFAVEKSNRAAVGIIQKANFVSLPQPQKGNHK